MSSFSYSKYNVTHNGIKKRAIMRKLKTMKIFFINFTFLLLSGDSFIKVRFTLFLNETIIKDLFKLFGFFLMWDYHLCAVIEHKEKNIGSESESVI